MVAQFAGRTIFAVEFEDDSVAKFCKGSTLVVPDPCARRFSITQLRIGFKQWFVDRSHRQFAEFAIL
jgi:hypothetical protein